LRLVQAGSARFGSGASTADDGESAAVVVEVVVGSDVSATFTLGGSL
jgi:hypothetical protein